MFAALRRKPAKVSAWVFNSAKFFPVCFWTLSHFSAASSAGCAARFTASGFFFAIILKIALVTRSSTIRGTCLHRSKRATVSGLTPANTANSSCLSRRILRNLRNPALRFLSSAFTCDLPPSMGHHNSHLLWQMRTGSRLEQALW